MRLPLAGENPERRLDWRITYLLRLTNYGVIMKVISRDEAISQGLKHYFTGKPCKHGHVNTRLVSNGRCCECKKMQAKNWRNKNNGYNKEYRTKNKEAIAEKKKEYYAKNKNKITEWGKDYRAKNKDKISEYRKQNRDKRYDQYKEWYAKNKDIRNKKKKDYYIKNKDKLAEWAKEYRKQNPEQFFLRNSLNRIFFNWKGSRGKAEELHGYTIEQLVARIEFQFKDGMSWDNRSEWHIDHKKPIARFLEQGITDPKIVNALSNLQPMWASENRSKGAKFEL